VYHCRRNNLFPLQWRFEPLGQGYSIRNVSTGLYVTSEVGIGDNVPVVASPFPSSWVVGVDGNNDGYIWLVLAIDC
jgi:hypothetical protein